MNKAGSHSPIVPQNVTRGKSLVKACDQLTYLEPAGPASGDRYICGFGRDRRLGSLGPERRALDRRRLAAPFAAHRLAGEGRIGTNPEVLQNMALLEFGTTANAANPFLPS
jgi:hypothetical protein